MELEGPSESADLHQDCIRWLGSTQTPSGPPERGAVLLPWSPDSHNGKSITTACLVIRDWSRINDSTTRDVLLIESVPVPQLSAISDTLAYWFPSELEHPETCHSYCVVWISSATWATETPLTALSQTVFCVQGIKNRSLNDTLSSTILRSGYIPTSTLNR